MKIRIAVLGVLAGVGVLLSGCGSQSSSYKQADKTFTKMDALKSELLQGKEQIGKMMTALNEVVASAESDPRPAYEKFKTEYSNIQKQADKVRKTAEQMKKEGQAYFDAWETEFEKVANEDLKNRFERRKTELASQYNKIAQYAELVKNDYEKFNQNINDINVVLGVDLTAGGIKSISSDIQNAEKESRAINDHIDIYVKIIDAVAEIFKPGGNI